MAKPTQPFVEVVWNDAWVRADEPVTLADVAASHKPMVIHTLGYLLREDEVGVSLANEFYDEDGTFRGRTFIYRPMLISVKPYRPPRKPRKPYRQPLSVPERPTGTGNNQAEDCGDKPSG